MWTRIRIVLALALGVSACGSQTTAFPPPDGGRDGSHLDGKSAWDQPFSPDLDPATCRAIDSCLYRCSTTDKACIDACLKRGSPSAQAQLTAWNNCQQAQLQGPCASSCAVLDLKCGLCLDPPCGKEFAACFGVAAIGQGSKTCPQAHACLAACKPADTLCVKQCFYAGTSEAQGRLVALETCNRLALAGSCKAACADLQSEACRTCLNQSCKSESVACLGN